MQDSIKQRDTRQRRLILETVMAHKDHPNADELYDDIHRKDPHISKATVYRNLKVLAESGEIRRVRVPGTDRYDSTLPDHDHILCLCCGHVCDAPVPYAAQNDSDVARETGYRVFRHHTVYEGYCPSCQRLPYIV